MNITIQSPNVTIDEALDAFIRDKVEKLSRFEDRIVAAEVFIKLDHSGTDENRVCEVRLSVPGNDLFAKSTAPGFEQAIAETVDALERQLSKRKTQLHKGRM
ncbi:MAG: ribosome-associated translation inhibitor RaiA [Bacteroidota bacterium]